MGRIYGESICTFTPLANPSRLSSKILQKSMYNLYSIGVYKNLEYFQDFFACVCVFKKHVCLFQGWNGYQGLPGFPFCLTNVSIFAEDPQSCEFPLHHYSGLGNLDKSEQLMHFLANN